MSTLADQLIQMIIYAGDSDVFLVKCQGLSSAWHY